jgi:hypothetical protein
MNNKVKVYNQKYIIRSPHQLWLRLSNQRECDRLGMWGGSEEKCI